ncbi:MAG: DUF3987 domain-containing protein [Methylococcaceae bacterium]
MVEIPKNYHGHPLIYSWIYRDKNNKALGAVARYQDKTGKKETVPFFNRTGTNWTAGIDLNPRPLFGLEKLAAHPKDKPVFIVEGERCTAALHGLGLCALTSLGGSQAAKKSDWTALNGFELVYMFPDFDGAGEHYALDVLELLAALPEPPKTKTVRLPGLLPAGDVVDWLQCWLDNWDGYAPITDELHETLKAKLWAEIQKPSTEPKAIINDYAWNVPGEIVPKLPKVAPLSAELIPEPFRDWLADVSHRMQTPGDFAAVSSLVIVGSLIGVGCGVRPKQLDDWEVIPNVWGACIGRPSVVLKSPSMKEPMGLLDRLQAAFGAIYEREKAEGDFQGLIDGAVLKDLKAQLDKSAKGKGTFNKDELQRLRDEFIELTENAESEPARRLLKTNETSIQSMTLLQNQNPRGLLVFRDELTGLLARWDREDGADERAYFLEGWNGNGSYTDVKIGRGVTEAKTICIGLLGGIQPDKLKKYLHQTQQGGNDGMMQRLQLAVWPDEPKVWQLVDIKPNKDAKQAAFLIMQALSDMDFIGHGATQNSHDDRPYFRFDDDAQLIFNDWLTNLQTVKIKQEDNPLMIEHFGKFRSLLPSLALIFHCIDLADGRASGAITKRAAMLAVDWCDYLETHARRIYAMAESPGHEAAVRLADKIKAGSLPNPFNAREVYIKCWHGLGDKKDVEAACDALMDENWLRRVMLPKPATGRQPLPEFHINPAIL